MTFLLQHLSKNLKKSPNTLEDLKFVLATIAEIRSKSLVMELRYRDVQERYRTMAMYHLQVSELVPPRRLAVGFNTETLFRNVAQTYCHAFAYDFK